MVEPWPLYLATRDCESKSYGSKTSRAWVSQTGPVLAWRESSGWPSRWAAVESAVCRLVVRAPYRAGRLAIDPPLAQKSRRANVRVPRPASRSEPRCRMEPGLAGARCPRFSFAPTGVDTPGLRVCRPSAGRVAIGSVLLRLRASGTSQHRRVLSARPI